MQPGLGVMLEYLGGGGESPSKYYGRTIKKFKLVDDCIRLKFTDGATLSITDDGQSCCEARYITTDDEPGDLHGAVLTEIKEKDYTYTNNDDGWDCHEIVFLEFVTDKGSVVFETHNEHNGYYGGFALKIKEARAPRTDRRAQVKES